MKECTPMDIKRAKQEIEHAVKAYLSLIHI